MLSTAGTLYRETSSAFSLGSDHNYDMFSAHDISIVCSIFFDDSYNTIGISYITSVTFKIHHSLTILMDKTKNLGNNSLLCVISNYFMICNRHFAKLFCKSRSYVVSKSSRIIVTEIFKEIAVEVFQRNNFKSFNLFLKLILNNF